MKICIQPQQTSIRLVSGNLNLRQKCEMLIKFVTHKLLLFVKLEIGRTRICL
jgi:hypothetical protein